MILLFAWRGEQRREIRKCLVITFGLVATLWCISLSVKAKADAKRYAIIMEALGESNAALPQKLADLEESLVATGTPRPDAQEAISAALRTPFINPPAILQIVALTRDISAVMGTNIVRETDEFLRAFALGDSAIQYCIARNALSAKDIAKLHYLDQHAHSREALETALRRLQERFSGSYERLRESK
jgi:hypothetical protein